MKQKEDDTYNDIIRLSRPVSRTHSPMPLSDRAAQFSPFAALTGYERALEETKDMAIERVENERETERWTEDE